MIDKDKEKIIDVEMTNIEKPSRVRQYPDGHKGPYVVIIRTVKGNKSLEVKNITKNLYGQYECIERIDVSEHKMRIIFNESVKKKIMSPDGTSLLNGLSARSEANKLAKEVNAKYRIYIPEKYVEVKGVIAWAKDESISDFVTNGKGKFSHSALGEVKVLEAVRLMRKSEVAEEATNVQENPKLENTGLVVLTFEGLLLPNKFSLDGLLTNVREFKPKQMFCTHCLKYNHTEKFCNNKKATPAQNNACAQCNSEEHESGSIKCPRRKILEKKALEHVRQVRRKTYAELLAELDPNNVMPNEPQNNNNQESFPPLIAPSRKRQAEEKRKERTLANIFGSADSPDRKRRTPQNANESPPPGFINPNLQKSGFADTCVEFIRELIVKMNLPPFLLQLFDDYAIPFIHKLVFDTTNSFNQTFTTWMTPSQQ